MNQLIIGILILIFGIVVGGVGIASAGVGIGIPMIPLGIYISIRGYRAIKYEREQRFSNVINPMPLTPFEKTRLGKVGLGSLLILLGVGTSALLIGIPLIAYGVWTIYCAFFKTST